MTTEKRKYDDVSVFWQRLKALMNFFAVGQNINTDSPAHLERRELIHEREGSCRQSFRGQKRETKCRLWFKKKLTSERDVNLQLGK